MTERPILFSAEMVRAILAGRKTQTRRKMKVQPYPDSIVTVEHFNQTVIDRHGDMQPGPEIFGAHWDDGEYGCRCPYGDPGDLLWVRETWGRTTNVNDSPLWPGRAHIPMAGGEVVIFAADGGWQWCDGDGFATERSMWRPSIHMPRWASRITLRITDVRVERLQDIREDDARAEGCDPVIHEDGAIDCGTRKTTFARLWNRINGPGAWDANPWVWVISFERVKP